jgi:hypothetical protein
LVVGFVMGFAFFPAAAAVFHSIGASLIIGALAGGTLAGIFQTLLLLQWLKEPVWLAVASALGGPAFLIAGGPFGSQVILGGLAGGAAYGFITGLVLEWQRPRTDLKASPRPPDLD